MKKEDLLALLLGRQISVTEALVLYECSRGAKGMADLITMVGGKRDCVRRAVYMLQKKGFVEACGQQYSVSCEKISQKKRDVFKEEFESLLAGARGIFRRYLYSRVREEQDRDDILQGATFKAYLRFDTFTRGSNFAGWMLRIIKNEIYDYYKNKNMQLVDGGERVPDTTGAQDKGVEYQEISLTVLNMLPSELAKALYLQIHGISYREIAVLNNIPEGTVKSRVHRAKEILKEKMKIN